MKKRREIEVLNALVKKKDERATFLCDKILMKRLKDYPDLAQEITDDIVKAHGKQRKKDN